MNQKKKMQAPEDLEEQERKEDEAAPEKGKEKDGWNKETASNLAIGLSLGIVFGLLFHNIALESPLGRHSALLAMKSKRKNKGFYKNRQREIFSLPVLQF